MTLGELLSQIWEIFKGIWKMIWETKEVVDNNAIFGIRGEIIKAIGILSTIIAGIILYLKRRR